MPQKEMLPHFVYYFASSSDGFVADARGGVAWLDAYDDVDYGFSQFIKDIDGVVMGRKTYEQALTFGEWGFKSTPCLVLSRTRSEGPHVEKFWSEPVSGLPAYFAAKGIRRVWMIGGGAAAAALLNAGLISEIEQHVIPVVLGSGVHAYGELEKSVPLKLTETRAYKNGVVMLKYGLK